LLRAVVPGLARVAVFTDPLSLGQLEAWDESQSAAPALGIEVQRVDFTSVQEMQAVFASDVLDHVQAAAGGSANVLLQALDRWVELLMQHRLPAIHAQRVFVEAGVLMSYGQKGGPPVQSRRAATYVDKILKGARPAELPVQQPSEFEFVFNVKTAQALSLTIPPDVAAQVTEWIQ
jgi:putative ABC transport system substrate-binding protein